MFSIILQKILQNVGNIEIDGKIGENYRLILQKILHNVQNIEIDGKIGENYRLRCESFLSITLPRFIKSYRISFY